MKTAARKDVELSESPQKYSVRFLVLVTLFVTTLLTANIIAVKLIAVGAMILPAAVIIFPVSYILGDVLTEVYGYSAARRVIWLGFVCNAFMVLAIMAAGALPAAPSWAAQSAYARILGFAPRILAASFAAYLVGEFVNSAVLAKMKVATQGRWLWTRTVASTLVGQAFDSVIFITIVFTGIIPRDALVSAIVAQWAFKVIYEIVATPLTYVIVGYLKRTEGSDVFDRDTNMNPFALNR